MLESEIDPLNTRCIEKNITYFLIAYPISNKYVALRGWEVLFYCLNVFTLGV